MITQSEFGTTSKGYSVSLFTLSNGIVSVKITNFGGIIVAVEVPDKHKQVADVVLGFDNIKGLLLCLGFDVYLYVTYIN